MRWKKNEPTAAKRRMMFVVYDDDGALAVPTTSFSAAGELQVDPSAGAFVAAAGTLANVTKPITIGATTFTTTNATETVNITAHGRATGSGPVQLTTTGGLPAGYALATNYWIINTGANTLQLASSLANALAGTPVAITTDGTGTHTMTGTAGCQELVVGHWTYTATQAETNISGAYFAVKIEKSGFKTITSVVDLFEKEMDDVAEGAHTYGDLTRLMVSILAGKAGVFNTGTITFKALDGTTTRHTVTKDATGRLTAVVGTLT